MLQLWLIVVLRRRTVERYGLRISNRRIGKRQFALELPCLLRAELDSNSAQPKRRERALALITGD